MTESIVVPRKRCSRCKRWFPPTRRYFNRTKNKKSGLEYHCRGCRYGWDEDTFQADVLRDALLARGYKPCRDCDKVLAFSAYAVAIQCVGGVRPECKVCANDASMEYRKQEDVQEKRREYLQRPEIKARIRAREQTPEYKAMKSAYDKSEDRKAIRRGQNQNPEVIARRKAYYARPDIRERERINKREWSQREENKAKAQQYSRRPEIRKRRNAYQQQRYRNNPRVRKQFIILGAKRRARLESLPATLTEAQWYRAVDYFGGCCAVCGRSESKSHLLAADHWEALTKGGGTEVLNIVPLCHTRRGHTGGCCNLSKRNYEPIEWLIGEYGEEKAREIEARIKAYFAWVREQDDTE